MSTRTDPALQQALDALAPCISIGHRLIAPGDEAALTDDEARSIATTVLAVRRASGSARLVVRDLLARLGHPGCAVLKTASGAPAWPAGIVGSLAHDDQVAVAAVARRGDVAALGIDVEPAEPLPDDVLDLVATEPERPGLAGDPIAGRLLFVAKEAVYKAVYPLDGVILDFHDITVDLAGREAVVHNGRVLDLRICRVPRLVVLALARPDPRESSP
ncbi:MAG: 4'-phosphopantetheinyl transferase superfamily protein [Rhodoplanes sp.]|uniref:4'-phosphopantetheinyl transferase family protein n=1 Tax=Rhodoplanes sp. TaxID=1968906 RepID=UPI001816CBB9|nr:4'-phosphopantetheinyl transferase superfamily protein [Rhodoplanes sp.]NVO12431.1 4'-phosphopantetheinyl transferase superfamily protein [Rhodoplanes sp.]